MTSVRLNFPATLLQTGKILSVSGSLGAGLSSTADLYDPAAGTFAPTGAPATARSSHTATLLPTGSVLVVGGDDVTPTPLGTVELYDPALGTWAAADPIATARGHHTATPLLSGGVLIAGGTGLSGALASAEVYVASATPLAISPTTATAAPSGSITFTASGGSGTGYLFFSASPSGGSITRAGVYTAGSVGGVTDVVVLTDSLGNAATQNVTVTASPTPSPSPTPAPTKSSGCASLGDGGWLSVLAALAATALFRRRSRPAQPS
jgi:Galactose oxidase, central domain